MRGRWGWVLGRVIDMQREAGGGDLRFSAIALTGPGGECGCLRDWAGLCTVVIVIAWNGKDGMAWRFGMVASYLSMA